MENKTGRNLHDSHVDYRSVPSAGPRTLVFPHPLHLGPWKTLQPPPQGQKKLVQQSQTLLSRQGLSRDRGFPAINNAVPLGVQGASSGPAPGGNSPRVAHHPIPSWIGSNFRAENPDVVHAFEAYTAPCKEHSRLRMAAGLSRAPHGPISSRGHGWPTSEPTDALGGTWWGALTLSQGFPPDV